MKIKCLLYVEHRLSWEFENLYVASVQKISEPIFFLVGSSMAKLCPFFDSATIAIEKTLSIDYLENRLILIFGIWLGINV